MQEIRVYTTSTCGYCRAAKQLLANQNLDYVEIPLDGASQLRTELSERNGGWRTVPMIYIGDSFVGGFTELKGLADRGELAVRVGASKA